MDNADLRKTPLAAAVSLALGLGGAQAAQAQGASGDEELMEEVLVVGIRSSLRRAMDFKRDTAGVVDAITAEDIGDFPDSNLAESLQRITGVSIDRARGEGSRVTVRGFGPDFNLVTLNGRQMPTSNLGDNLLNRSFDFANLASENIAAVEVYKTGQADVPSGGIGSTINIRTARPLDAPGLTATATATTIHDASTELGSDWTPQVSGLFSGTFLDDRIGVAVSATYTERDSGLDQARVNGFRSIIDSDGGWGEIPRDSQQINRPSGGDIYGVPQALGYSFEEFEQVRLNGQLTVQYQPIDDLTITLDHTHAAYEISHEYHDYSAWYNFGGQKSSVWRDGPSASAIRYTETGGANDFSMGGGVDASRTELNSSGLNLVWDATDRLQLALDAHVSTSESEPDSVWGNRALVSTATFTRERTTSFYGAGRIPLLELDFSQPLSAQTMIVTGSVFENHVAEMGVEQAKLSGSYEFDTRFVTGIDFGVQLTQTDYESATAVVQRDAWGGVTAAGDIADLAQPASMGDAFDEFAGTSDPNLQRDYYRFDFENLIARTEAIIAQQRADLIKDFEDDTGRRDAERARRQKLADAANLTLAQWEAQQDPALPVLLDEPATPANDSFLPPDPGPCGTGLCPTDTFQTDRFTNEDTEAAYFQVRAETEWRGHPVEMRLGMRYEQTKIVSEALTPVYSELRWVADNEITALRSGQEYVEFDGDYSYWLPNFDLRMNITDDLIGRLSLSRTLTRPDFEAIQGGKTINQLVRLDGGNGQLGDPALLPYRSKNVDLSFEYYYSEDSYVSGGYFHKGVNNFIGTQEVEEQTYQLPHPGMGSLYQAGVDGAKAANVGKDPADRISPRQWILNNMPNAEGVVITGRDEREMNNLGYIVGVEGRDGINTFRFTQPINDEKATIDGVEFAWQHNFGESGFGFILNATVVNADVGYDNLSKDEQHVITGLSDSANFIGFYDKNGIGVRLTYNWRDAFLAGEGQPIGRDGPTYVDQHEQWDLNASYWLTDDMQISLDVINLTNETRYLYGRSRHQTLFAEQLGTRYHLNFRYKFSN